MSTNYPINPRVRALGKARIDIARRVQSVEDWQSLWKRPAHPFPFAWGERWNQCVEYKVDDFAAEVGFFIDILGLPVNAFDPDYAMFTSPEGDFFFAVIPAGEGNSTPPDAIRLQFMVADIFETTAELETRGIAFEQPPQPVQPGSTLHIATFLTPHGICIDLWGMLPSRRPSLATIAEEDDEEVFLPERDDDAPSLFTTQDAAPLKTQVRPPPQVPLHPTPQADAGDEDDEFDDDDDDDDDIEYVDIDTP
jgi:catechol 2,3-dioxygenase-like lactoylglutathione lyase family enzyme